MCWLKLRPFNPPRGVLGQAWALRAQSWKRSWKWIPGAFRPWGQIVKSRVEKESKSGPKNSSRGIEGSQGSCAKKPCMQHHLSCFWRNGDDMTEHPSHAALPATYLRPHNGGALNHYISNPDISELCFQHVVLSRRRFPSRWHFGCGIALERALQIDLSSDIFTAKSHFQMSPFRAS